MEEDAEEEDQKQKLATSAQLKKRTVQEAKHILESDEDDIQVVKKRQKTGTNEERRLLGAPEDFASGSEAEYENVEQMNKKPSTTLPGEGDDSSSSSDSDSDSSDSDSADNNVGL